jgi:hypothetical protein
MTSIKSECLVRAKWDRKIQDAEGAELKHLWQKVESCPSAGTITLDKGEELEIRYCPVTIQAPADNSKKKKQLKKISLNKIQLKKKQVKKKKPKAKVINQQIQLYAIQAKQINAQPGIEPLEWMLLTNIPVTDLVGAKEKISWYKLRWRIEIYHKVLKSGYAIEKAQLKTGTRLKNWIAIVHIIAWRIYYMTHVARADPEAPASTILTADEILALELQHADSKPDKKFCKNLTVLKAIIMIAKLGGFNARKCDGFPGAKTIWMGFEIIRNSVDVCKQYKNYIARNEKFFNS